MHDSINPATGADDATPSAEDAQHVDNPAGEIVTPARFGIGARASLMLGLSMGTIAAVAAVCTTVSAPHGS